MDRLWRRTTLGAIRFLAALALLLFLPAGTLRFWEGWLYWAILALGTASNTVYFLRRDPRLIARRLTGGPAAEPRGRQKRIMAAAVVLSLALIVVPGLDHRWQWSAVPGRLVLLADLALGLGYLIVFLTFQQNSFAASIITVEPGQRVIATGLYAQVRHPLYAGASAMVLATPLALGSYWGLLPACGLVGAIVFRLLDEERYLCGALPGYDAYRRSVRYRLLPGIW